MSDFSPVADDYSPPPLAPSPEAPAIIEEQDQAENETLKTAQPYYHAAWESVMKVFDDKIASYADSSNAIVLKDQIAEEFKISMLVAAIVTGEIKSIKEDVLRAVESVEQQPSRPKPEERPRTGA